MFKLLNQTPGSSSSPAFKLYGSINNDYELKEKYKMVVIKLLIQTG
jgi:hypothetical protein